MAASTVRRSARVPARWPAPTGRRRHRAQRPFPSMMIAIERATSGSSPSGRGRSARKVLSLVRRLKVRRLLNLHDLGFLALEEVVDPRDMLVRELLHPLLGATLFIVADVPVANELLQVVHRVATHVPHGDAALFCQSAHDLDELLAPLLGQLRNRQPDELAVVRRRQPQIGLLDRPLDALDRPGVVRLNRDRARLRHVHRRELLERCHRPVVVDLDPVEQRRGRPARAHGVELVRRRLEGLVHLAARLADEIVHRGHSVLRGVEMTAMDDFVSEASRKMDKSLESAAHEFNTVRTGRASAALLDRIQIDYYGTMTPLQQLATVNVPEPRSITIQPYDPGSIKSIERAIQESDLGLTPSNDGKLIRLPIPQLTEERRKELVKVVRGLAEEGRVAVRNVRRDAMHHLKELVRNGDVGDDEERRAEERVQKLTDEHVARIDDLLKRKEAEIMEV